MRATMSIRGLWYYDKTIFDNLELPKDVDKDFLTNNLLIDLDELEVLYPDPRVMRETIGLWSHIQCPIWQKLIETTQYDYNPIHNYDRHEDYTDDYGESTNGTSNINRNGNNESSGKSEAETNDKGSYTRDQTDTPGVTETTSNYVTGYNSTLETLHDKSVTNRQGTNQLHISDTNSNNRDYNDSRSDKASYSDTEVGSNQGTKISSMAHKAYMYGNIGITTTQEMINQQREVVKFNIYDYIIKDFKNRFCIMLY